MRGGLAEVVVSDGWEMMSNYRSVLEGVALLTHNMRHQVLAHS